MTTTQHDYAAQAQRAIEIVCAGELNRMHEFYNPAFVDHINEMTFHGYEGGQESVSFYTTLFKNLRMGTEEQITEGSKVASRWFMSGTYRGRAVTLRGTTISHFDEDGRILEDCGHTDSLALLSQIGILRTLLLGLEVLTRRVKLPKGVVRARL